MRIPLSNKAGLISHQRSSVPMTGAPDSGFGMEDARAGMRLIESIGGALSGAAQLAGSMARFVEEERATNDKLMATEDQNLLASSAGKLDETLAANPGWSDEQKNAVIEEWRKTYADSRLQFLDKMSPKFRTQHEATMRGMEQQYARRRSLILTQGRVQRDTDLANNQINAAVQEGRIQDAKAVIAMHTGKLWTAETAADMGIKVDQQGAYFDVKRRIDAGAFGVAEELQQNKIAGLTEQNREKLLHYAKAKEAERESQEDAVLCAELAMGRLPYSSDELDEKKQQGMIGDAQYLRQKKWITKFEQEQKRSVDYQASQQEKAEAASRQQQYNKLLLDCGFDAQGYARTMNKAQFADAYSKLMKICGKDYDMAKKGSEALNGLLTKNLKYRDTPLYKEGDLYLAGLKAQGKIAAGTQGWFSMKEGKDKSAATVSYLDRELRMFLENYVADHPQAKYTELQQEIDKKVSEFNKKSVEQIAAFSAGERSVRRGAESVKERNNLAPGTVVDGFVFIGGDPAKKECWRRR